MSADNGVYILKTDGPEFRVAYHMSVENYMWDDEKNEESDNPDVWIANARNMWKNSLVFKSKDDVLLFASRIAIGYTVLEYGISIIDIPRKF